MKHSRSAADGWPRWFWQSAAESIQIRVAAERIQINEDTVWAGEKRDRNNPASAVSVPEVRRLLFVGKPKEAEQLAEKTMIAIGRRMPPPYQPLGDLILKFAGQADENEYRRELDLDSAIASVSCVSSGKLHARGLCLAADGVIEI
jgi:alpha-L-fucosidase 2